MAAPPPAPPDRFDPDLVRGSLDLMVLSVLSGGPMYGLAVQGALRSASGGRVEAGPGTLYPLLHRLEADGLIAASWHSGEGRRRKWYALTAGGRRRLSDRAAQWLAYADLVRGLLEPAVGGLQGGLTGLAPKPA